MEIDKQYGEYKVIMKLEQEGSSFGKWNPIQLTVSLNKLIGEIKSARIMGNGALLIECKDNAQQNKATKLNKIEGQKVVVTKVENKKFVRGVISGVPIVVTIEQIRNNVTGAKVVEVKHLKTTRNGECDSLALMLKINGEKLSSRVYIGYMSYEVRAYVPPPLRCFKCQKYGHVAAVCRGKQKCGRCAGEHEYGKCEEGAKLKCCNCGGEHSSAYRGCESCRNSESENISRDLICRSSKKSTSSVRKTKREGNRSYHKECV